MGFVIEIKQDNENPEGYSTSTKKRKGLKCSFDI